jgi:hypothetical protein
MSFLRLGYRHFLGLELYGLVIVIDRSDVRLFTLDMVLDLDVWLLAWFALRE